jgi:hypothetical protein
LAHSFRGFSPWSVGSVASGAGHHDGGEHVVGESGSLHGGQESEGERKRPGTWYALQRYTPSDPLPPIRPHLP